MGGSETPGRAQGQSIYPRRELIGLLADAVGSVTVPHPTRVAVDGPPAAGKTTLADELAAVLRARGRYVIRATVDDFLFPRARRYRRGEFSAEGCYVDTHDHGSLNRVLLDPLGPGGDRRFRPTVYDHATDTVLSPPPTTAPADAVLVFDGVFLLRPELVDRWELRVFVSTALDKTVDRAVIRESRVSTRADVERRWHERYFPAQRLYFATARPAEHADVVVHNDDPGRPMWEIRAGGDGRLAAHGQESGGRLDRGVRAGVAHTGHCGARHDVHARRDLPAGAVPGSGGRPARHRPHVGQRTRRTRRGLPDDLGGRRGRRRHRCGPGAGPVRRPGPPGVARPLDHAVRRGRPLPVVRGVAVRAGTADHRRRVTTAVAA
ncbi:uridine kinase [Micromonospora sp. M42]|nr:uridine kinase [Micromonospora sp. M42]